MYYYLCYSIHSVPESDGILVTDMKQVYSLVPKCAMWFLIYPFIGFIFLLVFTYNLVFKTCLFLGLWCAPPATRCP